LPLGKLLTLSGQEICAILARHGFVGVRQCGSHVIMQKHLEKLLSRFLCRTIQKFVSGHSNPLSDSLVFQEANLNHNSHAGCPAHTLQRSFFNQHLGIFMTITLTIPDDVVQSLKLPRQRMESVPIRVVSSRWARFALPILLITPQLSIKKNPRSLRYAGFLSYNGST
jgi:hypothetical protein